MVDPGFDLGVGWGGASYYLACDGQLSVKTWYKRGDASGACVHIWSPTVYYICLFLNAYFVCLI